LEVILTNKEAHLEDSIRLSATISSPAIAQSLPISRKLAVQQRAVIQGMALTGKSVMLQHDQEAKAILSIVRPVIAGAALLIFLAISGVALRLTKRPARDFGFREQVSQLCPLAELARVSHEHN
jgi:hypothetical protein